MYPEYMSPSLEKVIQTRNKRFELAKSGKPVFPQMSAEEREEVLNKFHPDYKSDARRKIRIGPNKGEIITTEVADMLESHSSAAVGSAYVASERVPICRLDSIESRYLAPEANLFIKIDTQGFEWQVLDGANETLKRAHGVLCELSLVPLYDGQRLWRDIVDRLDDEGFMLWALQKGFTDSSTGQSLQVDGIFLRRHVLRE